MTRAQLIRHVSKENRPARKAAFASLLWRRMKKRSPDEIIQMMLNHCLDRLIPARDSENDPLPSFRRTSEVKPFDFEEWAHQVGFKRQGK